MSRLKVAAIKNESSSANNIVLNTDGTTTVGSITSSGTVSGATVTSTGDVNDSIGDVRSPQHFNVSTATTITEEGVYYCTNAPTLTFGGGIQGGTIMTFYNNNGSSMTLNRGSFLNTIRLAADNNTTNKSSVTLGAYSTTTATCFITNNFIVISGSDAT